MPLTFINKTIRFLAYSNLWIGWGAGVLTWQFYGVYNQPVNLKLIFFTVFSTVLTYTFQRYVKVVNATHGEGPRLDWMSENPITVRVILILSGLGTAYTALDFRLSSFLLLALLGALSFFYVIKVPGLLNQNLRDIPSLKIFLIGIVWAATSVALPYLNLPEPRIDFPWPIFVANLLFVIGITIPFDIRDMKLDEAEKKTIPQLIGAQRAIWVAQALVCINYGLLVFLTGLFLPITLIGTFIALILIRGSNANKSDEYFSFGVDGLLVVQPACLLFDYLIFVL